MDISTDSPLIVSHKPHPSNRSVCSGCGWIIGRCQTLRYTVGYIFTASKFSIFGIFSGFRTILCKSFKTKKKLLFHVPLPLNNYLFVVFVSSVLFVGNFCLFVCLLLLGCIFIYLERVDGESKANGGLPQIRR